MPIFHIHGDKDMVVPFEQNAAEPARRYKAEGGDMQLLRRRIRDTTTGRASSNARNWSISSSRTRASRDLR